MNKVTTDIDPVDMIKLSRMASRAGMTASDAAKIIYTHGVEFFLGMVVGATKKKLG